MSHVSQTIYGTPYPDPPDPKPAQAARPMLSQYKLAMIRPTINGQMFKRLQSAGLVELYDLPGLGFEDPTTGAAHAWILDDARRRGEDSAEAIGRMIMDPDGDFAHAFRRGGVE